MLKAHARVKTSKTGISGLGNSKSDASSDIQESAQTFTMDTSWNDGWISKSGTTTRVLLDGTKVGNRRMTFPQAHFRLEV